MRKTYRKKTKEKRKTISLKQKTRRQKQKGGSAEKFVRACEEGNLREAQYYFNKIPASLRSTYISADAFRPFRLACKNGHLNIARWLLQAKPNIDILARNNEPFINACKNGHLNVAQWLYRKSIENHQPMDLSLNDDYAFREACSNGHLDVAQWLLQTDRTIDITRRNDEAFIGTCFKRHLNVAQWLSSLKPEYEIRDENSEDWSCHVLTDPKDIKWNKKKKLAWLASQPRERDADNLVARMPTDVVRITASYL